MHARPGQDDACVFRTEQNRLRARPIRVAEVAILVTRYLLQLAGRCSCNVNGIDHVRLHLRLRLCGSPLTSPSTSPLPNLTSDFYLPNSDIRLLPSPVMHPRHAACGIHLHHRHAVRTYRRPPGGTGCWQVSPRLARSVRPESPPLHLLSPHRHLHPSFLATPSSRSRTTESDSDWRTRTRGAAIVNRLSITDQSHLPHGSATSPSTATWSK